MGNTNKPKSANNNNCILPRRTDMTSRIRVNDVVNLADGSVLLFSLDIERFYCVEVLFKPDLHEETKGQLSLPAVILEAVEQVDSLVRNDVCESIVLSGKTSLTPGLKERLKSELKSGMAALGVHDFQILCAEDSTTPPLQPSASWKGADSLVKRATDPFLPFNIEPAHFVTFSDFEEQGQRLEPNLF
jgi:actin-related protein